MVKTSKRAIHHSTEGELPEDIVYLLLRNAEGAEAAGHLDAALEMYLAVLRVSAQLRRCDLYSSNWGYADTMDAQTYADLCRWAARPKQIPERIITAQRQLRDVNPPRTLNDWVELQYVFLRRILTGGPAVLNTIAAGYARPLPIPTMLWLRLPWERARALRLLNFETYCELRGASGDVSPRQAICMDADAYNRVRQMQIGLLPLRHSELLYALRGQLDLPPISQDWEEGTNWRYQVTLAESFRALKTTRNAARVILALEAWKLQHGSLPKSLAELVGPFLDELPLDPYSWEPFRYFPEGLKIPLRRRSGEWSWPTSGSRDDISANEPFIWSTGPGVRVNRSAMTKEKIIYEYDIEVPLWRYGGVWNPTFCQPSSEYDVWQSGWPFAIP